MNFSNSFYFLILTLIKTITFLAFTKRARLFEYADACNYHIVSRSDFSHWRSNKKYYTVILLYSVQHGIVLRGRKHQHSGRHRILSKNSDHFNCSIFYTNSRLWCQTDHSLSKMHCLDLKKATNGRKRVTLTT